MQKTPIRYLNTTMNSIAGCSTDSTIRRQRLITKSYLLILAVMFIVSLPAFPASLVNVPLDHWSYQFIERMQAKGILCEYLSNSKPYSRGKVAEMIARTAYLYEGGSINLSPVEVKLLEEMKKEFSQELSELGTPGIQKHRHLLDWSDAERKLIAEIGFAQESTFSAGDDNMHLSTLAVSFYGDMLKNLSFYNLSRVSRVNKEPPLSKQNKDPRYLSYRCIGAGCASGLCDAYFVYGNQHISIQAGKDAILWGPGYHGVIGLAGVDPAFDTVKLHAEMWKVNFTSLLGFLRDDLTKKYQSDVPRKYLSAHRFELTPFPGLCIAWQEVYIYAERLYIELVNPIMLYQMAEDYLGDIGNNNMEVDAEIALIPNTKLYGALFLDDFHGDASPFKYPGFGWAILGGTKIVDPLGIDNTNIILEYARVEPWTYTHKGMKQDPPIPTAYKHFDEPLGHWIGPNADDLFTQIGWQISKNIQGNILYNRIRHGEIGGNIYDVADYSKEKKFLGGIVETEQAIGLELGYTTFHKLDVSFGYRYIKTKNKQKEEAMLPKSDKRWQPWESGWNTTENEFNVSMRIRY